MAWSLEISKILTVTFEDLIFSYLTVLGHFDPSAFSLVLGWDEERLREQFKLNISFGNE